MSLARRLVPAPIRALRWRLPCARASGAPHAMLRTLRFTLAELRGGDVSFRTPDGLGFVSMPNNFSSFAMFVAGARDPDIWRFIARRVPAGATVVDAGANVGAYTLPFARLVGPSGRVVAVEAHPLTHDFLARNIAANGLAQASALQLALGAEAGMSAIAYTDANPGETHVAADAGEAALQVRVYPLDDVLAGLGITRIDYLKIDVEGFELPVLQGARGIIATSPGIAVQTELQAKHAARYGHAIADIASLLAGLGLAPHRIRPDGTPERMTEPLAGDVVWFRP